MKHHIQLWFTGMRHPMSIENDVKRLSLNQAQYDELEDNLNTIWGMLYAVVLISLIVLVSVIVVYGTRATQVQYTSYILFPIIIMSLYNVFIMRRINRVLIEYADDHGLHHIDQLPLE